MSDNGVLVFPEAASQAASSIDPNLMLAMQNGGGFGANNWIWILFLWIIWQNGGFQNYRNAGGNFADLSAQMNGDTGREFILQALNGRADALTQLSQITNNSVETVKTGLYTIQSAIQNVTGQVGITALQTQNALALGNANISRQICECCCENRLAIANQTAALQAQAAANQSMLQAQIAANDANVRLQMAQIESADQLAVCQQTNQLGSQSDRNTNNILSAIANQNTLITKEFCDLKERELQNKIDTQGDIITQLRGQISNDKQTELFNSAINNLNEKIALLAAKQPNTVPVQYPNIIAANATPYVGYYPQNNFWN